MLNKINQIQWRRWLERTPIDNRHSVIYGPMVWRAPVSEGRTARRNHYARFGSANHNPHFVYLRITWASARYSLDSKNTSLTVVCYFLRCLSLVDLWIIITTWHFIGHCDCLFVYCDWPNIALWTLIFLRKRNNAMDVISSVFCICCWRSLNLVGGTRRRFVRSSSCKIIHF